MTAEKLELMPLIVQPFATDFARRWSWPCLANALLNAADNHASHRGFGLADAQRGGYAWVLSRLTIDMERVPLAYEAVEVSTWVKSLFHFFTNRCFAIRDAQGQPIGYGHSIWALIDTTTRQPLPLTALPGNPLQQYVDPTLPCPTGEMGRVKPLPDSALVRTLPTAYSDIDFNGHVNSVRYIEHVLDLFPLSDYDNGRNVKRIEIAYMAESRYGDTLAFYRRSLDANTHEVEIRRKREGEAEEGAVIVRCKVIFKE